jgi:polyvinyl alcohol dehydrogenase (cytochrome)
MRKIMQQEKNSQKNSRRKSGALIALVGTALCALAPLTAALGEGKGNAVWHFGGSDVFNTRNAAGEKRITPANVGQLAKKWEFATAGDVSATPTVETHGNTTTVYAVDWGGYLYSLDGATGVPNWSHKISQYTGNTVKSASRTSPAIVGDTLILGDQGDTNSDGFPQGGGTTASVMAVDKNSGKLAWRTVVSDHPFSGITSSPVADDGVIYVGVTSLEENAGFIPGYAYSWRGKVVALDAETGVILWSTKTISDDAYQSGYTGASVWGGTPVIDAARGLLYVTTGNNYSTPADGPTSPSSPVPAPSGDHFDSVIALSLRTGKLQWSFRAWNGDKWDVASWVFSGKPAWSFNTAGSLGPDWDFGSGPNLLTPKGGDQLLGAGAKSGIYYALDPDNGRVVWSTEDPHTQLSTLGPGGTGGGIEWGSATDGDRIYIGIANTNSRAYTLAKPSAGSALATNAGLWAGVDATTGRLLWQTADPRGGHDLGMVTIANGVMFAASNSGDLYALDAATGIIRWNFTALPSPSDGSPASSICGPSVVNGTVYWGSGYSHLTGAFGTSGTPRLYAFALK